MRDIEQGQRILGFERFDADLRAAAHDSSGQDFDDPVPSGGLVVNFCGDP